MTASDPRPDESTVHPAVGRLDRALTTILNEAEYALLRPGPWWELERRSDKEGAGWKRAFLERLPSAGAVHWGHWFLLLSPHHATVAPLGPPPSIRQVAAVIEIRVHDLEPDVDARLLVREIEGRGRLVKLARRTVTALQGAMTDRDVSETPKGT